SSGRDHHNRALAMDRVLFLNCDRTSRFVILRLASDLFDPTKMFRRRTGYENIVVVLVHRLDNLCDLVNCLAAAEDDFRKSLPERPVVIDVRKAQVLERKRTKAVKDLRF